MASGSDRRWLFIGLAATALSALGWWFGGGLHPHWWLTWVAPLPVLLLAPHVRPRWAAASAFAAGTVGGISWWDYLHNLIALPLPTILLFIGAPGLALALCVLLFRRLMQQRRPAAATLAVPVLWVGIEYLTALLSPHGTFGSIAYTQMDALPLIQIAALTGLWGTSFLVLLVPAALAAATTSGTTIAMRVRTAAIVLALLAGAWGFGIWRLQAEPLTTLRVGLVSLEKPIRPPLGDAAGKMLESRYVEAIDRLAAAGAQAVVIPETSFATPDATIPGFAALAQQHRLILAAGIDFKGDPHVERNMVMVFQPGRATPATYSKQHLIPGYEDHYTPGDRYTLLDGSPRIGVAICKDMDFPSIGRAYGARDAQILLVPAWDFGADGWLHSRMAIMRGVESGLAIARVARTGRLTLSDDRGRVVAEASSDGQDAELVGDLPIRATHTLYARWGDWFAWLDLVGLLGLLTIAWRGTRHRHR